MTSVPNQLSMLRILLAPVFYVCLVSPDPVTRQWSLAVFFLAAITDWYDGQIARSSNSVTRIGKFLDPLADKILTSSAFIAFGFLGLTPWWMVAVIVIRDLGMTGVRIYSEIKNLEFNTSKFAQTKTFVQMTVLYYILLVYVLKDVGWVHQHIGAMIPALLAPDLVYTLMLIVTILTVLTAIQYLFENRSVLFLKTGEQSLE